MTALIEAAGNPQLTSSECSRPELARACPAASYGFVNCPVLNTK